MKQDKTMDKQTQSAWNNWVRFTRYTKYSIIAVCVVLTGLGFLLY